MAETQWAENMARSLEKWGPKTDRALRMVAVPINSGDIWDALADMEALRLALAEATRERDEARRTVKALTPAANYCLEYKPLLLKAERERDDAVRILRDIATFGWYAKGARVARAYLAAREGR